MRLIDAEQKILKLKQPILQTRDVATYLNIPHAQASKMLDRLTEAGRFTRLMRGKWATTSQLDPLILPEYLTAPFPSYISLQTALFYYGMISQIPQIIYAVSLARTKRYVTKFGTFSIHHIQPDFFFEYETVKNIKMASPEKAFIDTLYLTPAKSKLFKSLPEIEFPTSFNFKKVKTIIKKISSLRMRTLVEKRLSELLSNLGTKEAF